MDQPQPWPARLRASLNERLVDVPDYVPYEPGPGRLPVAPPGSTATKRPSVWLSHGALLLRRHHRHLLRANPLPHSPLLPTLSFTLSSTLSSTRTAAALTAAALTAAALAAAALTAAALTARQARSSSRSASSAAARSWASSAWRGSIRSSLPSSARWRPARSSCSGRCAATAACRCAEVRVRG